MSTMNEFWQARLDKAKLLAAEYEDAITNILVGEIESYKLDTGQTAQTVTKHNIGVLERALDIQLNRVATLSTRLTGCGTHTGGPGW